MFTKFDKGILGLMALVVIVLAFSTYLKLDAKIVEGFISFLGMLFGFGIGKKVDSNV